MNVTWGEYPDNELADVIVKELKRLNIEDNPSCYLYTNSRNKLTTPSMTTITKRFGSWKEFIHRYTDFKYKHAIKWKEYTDEEFVSMVKAEIERIGGVITVNKYRESFNSVKAPSVTTIQDRFGSWNKFIEEYTDLDSHYKIRWSNYSVEELAAVILTEFKRIGDPIKYTRYSNLYDASTAPSPVTIKHIFGSWNKFIEDYATFKSNENGYK